MSSNKTVCIITGPTCGIGRVAVFKLFEKIENLHLILAARSEEKSKLLIEEIKQKHPNASVESIPLNLASFLSVRNFVKQFHQRKFPQLHLLILNGGCKVGKFELTEDGIETTFQVNHLSHFLLTTLLLDDLKQSAPSRIVVVASAVHIPGVGRGLNPEMLYSKEELNDQSKFDSMQRYRTSKLANVMFTHALARRLQGTNVKVACLSPGFIPTTSLIRNESWGTWFFMNWVLYWFPFARTVEHGGNMVTYVTIDNSIQSGAYYSDFKEVPTSKDSQVEEKQEQLWKLSEQLVSK